MHVTSFHRDAHTRVSPPRRVTPTTVVPLHRVRAPVPDMADAVRGYLERCRLRGLAINSLKAYGADLARAIMFFHARGVIYPQQVGERLVNAWLDDLARCGSGQRSIARRLAALRACFRYLVAEGWVDADPTAGVQVRFRPRRVIAPEMAELLAMVQMIRADRPADQRDRALLRLTLDTGLRVSEVCSLDIYDPKSPPRNTLDLTRLTVHITGKGGDEATLPLDERTARDIEAWLMVRPQMAADGCNALFVGRTGVRLSRVAAHNIARKRGAAAGMPRMHMHLLRHRRIGQVVEIMGLECGRHMARHRSQATTAAVYGAQAAEVVLRNIRRHCPLEGAA